MGDIVMNNQKFKMSMIRYYENKASIILDIRLKHYKDALKKIMILQNKQDYIKNKGKLVVGITEFEPMDYKDGDEWVGFDADMARLVAEKLGVEADFVVIDWDNKVMELDAKSE